uniref:Uncharacterized protein n=1 Tax=Equus asinus asinus TaxID=83772 RepID=A0A8C4LCS2_EQUAS
MPASSSPRRPCPSWRGCCSCTGPWGPLTPPGPRPRHGKGGHTAGAFEPCRCHCDVMVTSSFCLPCKASCVRSSGCITSTARSCPARPSASSTSSSSSHWPAGWPRRCWRGSSWRPSASSTSPWGLSGEGRLRRVGGGGRLLGPVLGQPLLEAISSLSTR